MILSNDISVVHGINSEDMMILKIRPTMFLVRKGYIIVVTFKYISREQNNKLIT
jgi:hypothetical protein